MQGVATPWYMLVNLLMEFKLEKCKAGKISQEIRDKSHAVTVNVFT